MWRVRSERYKDIKVYPGDTPWVDIMVDTEGQCSKCEGKGWKTTHEWREAELLGI